MKGPEEESPRAWFEATLISHKITSLSTAAVISLVVPSLLLNKKLAAVTASWCLVISTTNFPERYASQTLAVWSWLAVTIHLSSLDQFMLLICFEWPLISWVHLIRYLFLLLIPEFEGFNVVPEGIFDVYLEIDQM